MGTGDSQIQKSRESLERMPYHDVYAHSIETINGLYASSLGAGSIPENNAREIEIRNWITGTIIAKRKEKGDLKKEDIEAIVNGAEELKGDDKYLRYAKMIDAMADAKLIAVELRRYAIDMPLPAGVAKPEASGTD